LRLCASRSIRHALFSLSRARAAFAPESTGGPFA
jgi:hypothetical protein